MLHQGLCNERCFVTNDWPAPGRPIQITCKESGQFALVEGAGNAWARMAAAMPNRRDPFEPWIKRNLCMECPRAISDLTRGFVISNPDLFLPSKGGAR